MDRLQHQLTRLVVGLGVALLGGLGACGGDARARDAADLPRAAALARFRAGLPQPEAFTGGASSRDALVAALVRAVAASDTAELRALTLTRAEFAWLYYPTSREAQPPYDLDPELMWFMLETSHHKGLGHLLEARGGRPLAFAGYTCPLAPAQEGENTVWLACGVRRVQAPGDTVTERLFGPIVGRDGRFKFVSLANKLD